MFDHLTISHNKKTKTKAASHLGVGLVMLATIVVLILAAVKITLVSSILPAQAEARSQIRLLPVSQESRTVVGDLRNYTLASFDVQIENSPAQLSQLSFIVAGAYVRETITGLAIMLDGTQVGYPKVPDATDGRVVFYFDTVSLEPGVHRLDVKISTSGMLAGSALQLTFFPQQSFKLTSGNEGLANNVLWPYKTGVVNVISEGAVKVFAGAEENNMNSIHLYSQGEEFRLLNLSFEGDPEVLDGQRLDVFSGDKFSASAFFSSGKSVIIFGNASLRIDREQTTVLALTLPLWPETEPWPDIRLADVEAHGLTSSKDLNFPQVMKVSGK